MFRGINKETTHNVEYSAMGYVTSSTEVEHSNEIKMNDIKLCRDNRSLTTVTGADGSYSKHWMYIPKRYIVTMLAFLGYFAKFPIEMNVGIAIVAMTSNKTVMDGNETKIIPAEFNWSLEEKGIILSAYAFGSMFSFLGGWPVYRFGGATIASFMGLLTAVIELAFPLLLQAHLAVCIGGRALLGLLDGFIIIGFADVLAHWSPLGERTRLSSIAFTGMLLCGAANCPISEYIANTLGWQAIFYVSGTSLLVWCIVWINFVRNDPIDDNSIQEAEKNYIRHNNPVSDEKAPIPWKCLFSSKQVYAALNEIFCAAWLTSFIVECLPFYIKDMYKMNVQDIGLLTGIPLTCNVISTLLAAFIADYFRSKICSVGRVHRLFISGGQLLVPLLILVSSLCRDLLVSMICFSAMRFVYSFAAASYQLLPLDMAGQYGSLIKSLTITVFSLGSFLNPLVLEFMTPNHTPAEWNWYLLFLSCISVYGVIVFLIFGGGDLQPWAALPKPDNPNDRSTRAATEISERKDTCG